MVESVRAFLDFVPYDWCCGNIGKEAKADGT
jgi:hypothetical protein